MPGTVSAKVRWYGLPRDTNGDRVIPGAGWKGNAVVSNDLVDVVPLRDVLGTARDSQAPFGLLYGNPPAPDFSSPFERELPTPPSGGDYVAGMLNAPANVKAAFRYTCVWVNSAPTMIRIVMKLEDPAGRLPEGQSFEYVVGAP